MDGSAVGKYSPSMHKLKNKRDYAKEKNLIIKNTYFQSIPQIKSIMFTYVKTF